MSEGILAEPLVVDAILEEGIDQSIDLADPAWFEDLDDEQESAIRTALQDLGEQIEERSAELLLRNNIIFRTPFVIFIELSDNDWLSEFGDAPTGPLNKWDDVHSFFEKDLIVNYEMHKDEKLPKMYKNLVDSERRRVLGIQCNYASELSATSFLSDEQAKVFVLSIFGYKTARIAELLDKPRGTVSSHLGRARRKVERMNYGVNQIQYLEEEAAPIRSVLEERIGDVYWDPMNEQHVRVCGVDKLGGVALVYLVQYEDGDELDVSHRRLWEWEEPRSDDVGFPELVEFDFLND